MVDEETTPTPPSPEEPTATPPEAASAPTEPQVTQSEPQPAEAQTAQMGRSEPFAPQPEPITSPITTVESPAEPAPEPLGQDTKSTDSPAPAQNSPPISTTVQHLGRDVLVKARAMIQDRKHKKLQKIMAELEKNGKITNDEVEKLLHVSDATATRYLSALEKDGKIKQVGKTGIGVVYTKV